MATHLPVIAYYTMTNIFFLIVSFFNKEKISFKGLKAGTTKSLKLTDMLFCPVGNQGKVADKKGTFATMEQTCIIIEPKLTKLLEKVIFFTNSALILTKQGQGCYKTGQCIAIAGNFDKVITKSPSCHCWPKIVLKLYTQLTVIYCIMKCLLGSVFCQNFLCVKLV